MGRSGLGKQTTPLARLTSAGVYSTDDLGWLGGWGGVPLLAWEEVGLFAGLHERLHERLHESLHESEAYDTACVADHVEYWLEKENDHVLISDARLRNGLPAMNETELAMMHWGVCQARWARQAEARRAALAGALAAHGARGSLSSGSARGSLFPGSARSSRGSNSSGLNSCKRRRVCFADALLEAWRC